MDNHVQVLRVKTLAGKRIVLSAAKHNLREIQAEIGADSHIDISRTPDNYIIQGAGTAAGVAEHERELLADAEFPRPLRKNSVRAVEIIFSLPTDSEINHRAFFVAATDWAGQFYSVPVLSSIVHLDESAPHCHVLLLPLVDGRLQGSALLGNRANLLAMQSDFHEQVASRFGLARQTPQKRLSASLRHDLSGKVLAAIRASHDTLNEPGVKDALLELIVANPVPLASLLGVAMPETAPKKTRSFVQIMTKPQKPEKKSNPIGNGRPIPIGNGQKKDQSLCSVGNGFSAPAIIPGESPPAPVNSSVDQTVTQSLEAGDNDDEPGDYQRIRDVDQSADYWNPDTGEFIRPAIKQRMAGASLELARQQIAGLQARRYA